ncbi:hypothetical protein CVT24_012415 [Panaeolus cyanescens]|uniref:Uncharacterized protein n=1 Tax=Panaeolus cyanescens TaxID=181874 RepID=A0A409YJE5_9AGAR|nr:hypothetical protein CVT24_012415 [Panaeolus cyanescens]
MPQAGAPIFPATDERAPQGNATIALKWYPKLTPYRLLTVLVGVGLGTLKAILVAQGRVLASVEVEWVIGTAVIIIFFILSTYDDDLLKDGSATMWFFDYDCMNMCWKLVALIGVEPPTYSTHERSSTNFSLQDGHSRATPLITNYRLLVSGVTIAFGMVKAGVSYGNKSNGATVLDWVNGVIITALLYIIGLYEQNPNKIFFVLFDRDDSATVVYAVKEGGIALWLLVHVSAPVFLIPHFSRIFAKLKAMFKPDFTDQHSIEYGLWIIKISGWILTIEVYALALYLSFDCLYTLPPPHHLMPQGGGSILPVTVTNEHALQGNATIATKWYPKLTPYRLLTVLVVVGLGTLKAILVARGRELASVEVEWVLGTVVVIIIFLLSGYEDDLRKDGSATLWFFDYDCMKICWKLVALIGVEPPIYSTHERPSMNLNLQASLSQATPVITNYRLLVSAITIVFGMAKAALAYGNKSNGASALDWIYGVIVTTSLYILGLYEQNPNEIFYVLFDRNDSATVVYAGKEGGVVLFLLALVSIPMIGVPYLSYIIPQVHANIKPDFTARGLLKDRLFLIALSSWIMTIEGIAFWMYLSLFPLILAGRIMKRYLKSPNGLKGGASLNSS